MSLALCQVESKWLDTIPADVCVNTLHFASGIVVGDTIDYADVATTVANAFKAYYDSFEGGSVDDQRGITTKVYELDDAIPRIPRASHVIAATLNEALMGPRQVAMCLSFYSGASAMSKRNRGRIYLGPFPKSLMLASPPAALQTPLGALVTALGAAGGSGTEWVTFSRTGAGHSSVTHWWCDDRWDTMRGRLKKATSRVTGTTGG
jgi:hypothetical protein